MFKPSSNFLTDRFKAVLLLWILLLFVFLCLCLCHTVLSVSCSIGVTCWERADLLVLSHVMFSCVCHFPIRCPGSVVELDCIDS